MHQKAYIGWQEVTDLDFSHFSFNLGFLVIFPCVDLDFFAFKPTQ
jgi:hypothetical protein